MQKAKNVLEIACGTARLLPVAVMLKNQSTKYLGVDIADNMVKKAKLNLQQNFSKYDSKHTLDQWCLKHNMKLKVANAQEKITENDQKFDRIICNLVLMLTQNPQKMLKIRLMSFYYSQFWKKNKYFFFSKENRKSLEIFQSKKKVFASKYTRFFQSLYDQTEKECFLGVTVLGDKNKNGFLDSMRKSIIESGFELPNAMSPFHLSKKIGKMAQQIGWRNRFEMVAKYFIPFDRV